MYADFNYYEHTFSLHNPLKLTVEEFDRMSIQAKAYLDQATAGQITEVTDDVKNAYCAVVEVYAQSKRAKQSIAQGIGDVSSESVGEKSISYSFTRLQKQAGETASLSTQLKDAVYLYLSNTELLYRGC